MKKEIKLYSYSYSYNYGLKETLAKKEYNRRIHEYKLLHPNFSQQNFKNKKYKWRKELLNKFHDNSIFFREESKKLNAIVTIEIDGRRLKKSKFYDKLARQTNLALEMGQRLIFLDNQGTTALILNSVIF